MRSPILLLVVALTLATMSACKKAPAPETASANDYTDRYTIARVCDGGLKVYKLKNGELALWDEDHFEKLEPDALPNSCGAPTATTGTTGTLP